MLSISIYQTNLDNRGKKMSAQTAIQEDFISETLAAKIDRFAELTESLAAAKEEYEELKKELSEVANADGYDGKLTLHGYKHQVTFSELAKNTTLLVEPEELFRQYGLSVFKPDLVKAKSAEAAVKDGSVQNRKVKSFLKTHESAFWWKLGSRRLLKVG
jgi:flagellin-like hook-associated protein FlgL